MDFDLGEAEQAIFDLADRIIGDHCEHERLKRLADADDHVDSECWAALATAGVLGASLPESHGGAELGYLATAMTLEAVGAHASPVPVLPSVVMTAMPIAEFGTDTQRDQWLSGIAAGTTLGSACLYEMGTPLGEPATVARRVGNAFVVDGYKPMVQAGLDADVLVVPARMDDDSTGVLLVPANAEGVTRERVEVTTGHPMAAVTFTNATVDGDAVLGAGRGTEVLGWISQRVNTAMCMMVAGAARSAIRLAADYTKQRIQFDRPIATFQSVSNRAGDSYIDTEAITLSAYQAAWRIDAGLPADDQIAVARYWAAEAGFRVMHAAVHVHGGVGVDRDYPLHRHFLLARQLELTLGCAEEHLDALGRSIARRAGQVDPIT